MKFQPHLILLSTLQLAICHVISTPTRQAAKQTTTSSLPSVFPRQPVDIGVSFAIPGLSKNIDAHITLGKGQQSASASSTLALPPSITGSAIAAIDTDITLVPGCSTGIGGVVECRGPMQAMSGNLATPAASTISVRTQVFDQAAATSSVDLESSASTVAGQLGTITSLPGSSMQSASVVLAIPTPTILPAASKSSDNGLPTPSPVQSGVTSNCDMFYLVKKGDQCNAIAALYGISFDTFYKWNPAVGPACFSLLSDFFVCVSVIAGPAPATGVAQVSVLASTLQSSSGQTQATTAAISTALAGSLSQPNTLISSAVSIPTMSILGLTSISTSLSSSSVRIFPTINLSPSPTVSPTSSLTMSSETITSASLSFPIVDTVASAPMSVSIISCPDIYQGCIDSYKSAGNSPNMADCNAQAASCFGMQAIATPSSSALLTPKSSLLLPGVTTSAYTPLASTTAPIPLVFSTSESVSSFIASTPTSSPIPISLSSPGLSDSNTAPTTIKSTTTISLTTTHLLPPSPTPSSSQTSPLVPSVTIIPSSSSSIIATTSSQTTPSIVVLPFSAPPLPTKTDTSQDVGITIIGAARATAIGGVTKRMEKVGRESERRMRWVRRGMSFKDNEEEKGEKVEGVHWHDV